MATKHAFEMLTNIPTEVVPVIELSRLYQDKQLGFAPLNPLVIAVSNSGSIARLSEAVQRVNKAGGFTLGVTGNEHSVLGQHAKKIMKLDIPAFESAPGIRSYLVSIFSLLLLAIRFGEVRGVYTMDQANDYRKDILDQGLQLEKMLPVIDEQALAIAREWSGKACFDFVGTGFDLATAWYGHAKIIEALGKFAMHINSEEWLHLNFFVRQVDQMATVLVANTTNPAHSRNVEVARYMQELGRPMFVVSDGTAADFGVNCPVIQTPKTKYPISIPLTQFVPLSLLAGYIQQLVGEVDGRGCAGPWSFSEGGAAVKNSEIVVR